MMAKCIHGGLYGGRFCCKPIDDSVPPPGEKPPTPPGDTVPHPVKVEKLNDAHDRLVKERMDLFNGDDDDEDEEKGSAQQPSVDANGDEICWSKMPLPGSTTIQVITHQDIPLLPIDNSKAESLDVMLGRQHQSRTRQDQRGSRQDQSPARQDEGLPRQDQSEARRDQKEQSSPVTHHRTEVETVLRSRETVRSRSPAVANGTQQVVRMNDIDHHHQQHHHRHHPQTSIDNQHRPQTSIDNQHRPQTSIDNQQHLSRDRQHGGSWYASELANGTMTGPKELANGTVSVPTELANGTVSGPKELANGTMTGPPKELASGKESKPRQAPLHDQNRQSNPPPRDTKQVLKAPHFRGPSPVRHPEKNADGAISVSGHQICSYCKKELGRGAAMIIESLHLFYHYTCFRCHVCGVMLGNGTQGTDVRVRAARLHCQSCYSNDETGIQFSEV